VENRAAWSAAWGVVTCVFGAGTFAWWIAAAPTHSGLPIWPAYSFGVLALVGVYCTFAPLLHLRPFRASAEPEPNWAVVDRRILASTTLRLNLDDDLMDAGDAVKRYYVWHNETRAALPLGWRGDFTDPPPALRAGFFDGRTWDTEREYIAHCLEWDLEKLRTLKNHMRGQFDA
jgi:hypothetical protein